MNPFAELYRQFNTGDPKEKYDSLPDFPQMIDVELTNACNYRCIFCPTGLRALERPTGFMSKQVWKRLVEECAPRGTALRFIGWGEPLLHPDIIDVIAYASEYGLLTHINTNASKLTMELAERLVDAGLSSIKFSFQGVDRDSYKEMRQTDFFNGMLLAIGIMNNARGYSRLPYIAASTSVTNETEEQIERFRGRMEGLVDHLSIGHTTFDFLDDLTLKPKQKDALARVRKRDTSSRKHPDPCPEVYNKLSIAWDGSGRVCCNDVHGKTNLGRIGETTIKAMWRHGVIEQYRQSLARKEYEGPLCSVCFDYAELTEGT